MNQQTYPGLLTPGDAIQYWCKANDGDFDYESDEDESTLTLYWGLEAPRENLDELKRYLGMSSYRLEQCHGTMVFFKR